jgi:hypothetical protein
VTCGVTFTFGGLRITADGEVLNTDYRPVRRLYAAGELVGNLRLIAHLNAWLHPHASDGVPHRLAQRKIARWCRYHVSGRWGRIGGRWVM